MKISQQGNVVIVEDGVAARYGLGVLVPASIWPSMAGHPRFDLSVLAFVTVALVLALLNPPWASQFDVEKQELHVAIGWLPILGRRKTIPFDAIRDVKVSQFLPLGDDLGSARPVLVLTRGKRVLLSIYKRSPKRCREIIEQVRPLLGAGTST